MLYKYWKYLLWQVTEGGRSDGTKEGSCLSSSQLWSSATLLFGKPSPGEQESPTTEKYPSDGTLLCVHTCSGAHRLLCSPIYCSSPGSSVPRVLQARTLEWVALGSSRASSRPQDWTHVFFVSCIGRWLFNRWASREASNLLGIYYCLSVFIEI